MALDKQQLQDKDLEDGSILLSVLLLVFLLSAIAVSFTLTMRSSARSIANNVDKIRSEQLLKTGKNLAVIYLNDREAETSISSTRIETTTLGVLEMSFEDEEGKIDINAASPELLLQLFKQIQGVSPEQAVARILDYRDADDSERNHGAEAQEYKALGLAYGPKNGLFESVNELYQIPEIGDIRPILSYLTVHSRRSTIDFSRSPDGLKKIFFNVENEANLSSSNLRNFREFSHVSSESVFKVRLTAITLGDSISEKDFLVVRGGDTSISTY